MGTINHNAIIATAFRDEEIEKAKAWAAQQSDQFRPLFVFGDSTVNSYRHVVMLPDGSKEWWGISNDGNSVRDAFIEFLRTSGYWDWVEVQYGELGDKLVRSNGMATADGGLKRNAD